MWRTSVIFLVILLYPFVAVAQRFETLTVQHGLSSNHVFCIHQDSMGFMWFGTNRGLNRWDGYSFKIFEHDPKDSTTVSSNLVKCISEDSTGCLFLGTGNGLNIYDPRTETFTRYQFEGKIAENNAINCMFWDNDTLWLGTQNGLVRFNPRSKNSERFVLVPTTGNPAWLQNEKRNVRTICKPKPNILFLNGMNGELIQFDIRNKQFIQIQSYPYKTQELPVTTNKLFIDKSGNIWAGPSKIYFFRLDSTGRVVEKYPSHPNDTNRLSYPGVLDIVEGPHENLWIATFGGGLNCFNLKSKTFEYFTTESSAWNRISSDNLLSLYIDRQQNLWIGTSDNGVCVSYKWRKPFHVYSSEAPSLGLGRGEVLDLQEDQQGYLWVISHYGGITRIDLANNTGKNYIHSTPPHLARKSFLSVFQDRQGFLYFGSRYIARYNPKTNTAAYWKSKPWDMTQEMWGSFTCFCEDSTDRLWVGTFSIGLYCYDKTTDTVMRYVHDPHDTTSLVNDNIRVITQDRLGRVWIGTNDGLCLFESHNKFRRFCLSAEDSIDTAGSTINAIYEDSTGHLWIGTDRGLYQYIHTTETFRHYVHLLPPATTIFSVLEDSQRNLWLRTNLGLVKYNAEQHTVSIYDEGDGLVNARSVRSGYKAFKFGADGRIYYGGLNSVVWFYPDSLFDNPDMPPVVLTDMSINYNSVKPGQSPLSHSITTTEHLVLGHHENNLSFEFAALDFTAPTKNRYAYRLLGFQKDWVQANYNRIATFTNVPPGDYQFQVKASNNDGMWNHQGKSIRLVIRPPWWRTRGMYLLYALLAISLVGATWRIQTRRMQLHQELKMRQLEAEKFQELDRLKSQFFANISHEFRTPLTLIIGPVEQLWSKTKRVAWKHQLSLVLRNARYLQTLINQLLDFAKLEAG